MEKIMKFLSEAGSYFLATVENNKPKVRPFGAHVLINGRIYFCTGNSKQIFAQLKANPAVEICAVNKEYRWLRLSGDAVIDSTPENKEAMFAANPFLRKMYDNEQMIGLFEVFYIDNVKADISGMDGYHEVLK